MKDNDSPASRGPYVAPEGNRPYDPEDWHKAGFEPKDATDRRDLQEKMRAAHSASPFPPEGTGKSPEFMSLKEEAEFVNRATAVSRGIAKQGDMVNLPNHYARFKIEPIRFIGDNKLDWFQGNIVKYLMRHDAKNGLEDVRKAIRYANMYLLYLQDDPDWWKAGKPEDLHIGQ
jgi:hypothetical protein